MRPQWGAWRANRKPQETGKLICQPWLLQCTKSVPLALIPLIPQSAPLSLCIRGRRISATAFLSFPSPPPKPVCLGRATPRLALHRLFLIFSYLGHLKVMCSPSSLMSQCGQAPDAAFPILCSQEHWGSSVSPEPGEVSTWNLPTRTK